MYSFLCKLRFVLLGHNKKANTTTTEATRKAVTLTATKKAINQSILKIHLIIDCKSVILIIPKDILF